MPRSVRFQKDRARLTIVKHLYIFLDQGEGDIRRDETGKFYFIEGGRESAVLRVERLSRQMIGIRGPDRLAYVNREKTSYSVVS